MNISIFVTEDAMQFNLEAESAHEKKMFELLEKYSGKVVLGRGHDIGMCQGNYIRNFGDNPTALTITIGKED
jgi:hypothetical protein